MTPLSNLSFASLVAIIAFQYYHARRSSPTMFPHTTEASWQRYLGRREGLLKAIGSANMSDTPLFPVRELWHETSPMYTAWDLFPSAYQCPYKLERVGHLGDGGNWVMYSFGVGSEVSFEVEWLRRTNIFVHAFDYSVNTLGTPGLNNLTSRIKLHQLGIAGRDYTEYGHRFSTLKSIMSELGHEYIDILKMDVEGSEFPALETFFEDYKGRTLPFGQLLIEIHLWEGAPETVPDLVKWWEKLEAFGLRPVSDEPNLIAVTFGYGLPCCAEYTFINLNDARGVRWA